MQCFDVPVSNFSLFYESASCDFIPENSRRFFVSLALGNFIIC